MEHFQIDQPIIEADANLVFSTNRGTSLKKNGVSIHTTEHVLAAISGLQIDNLLIELDAAEIPILDGSSIKFTDALKKAGIRIQNKKKYVTTGIGSFIFLYLFTWIVSHTLVQTSTSPSIIPFP